MDLAIRNGTIITASETYAADLGVVGGRIVQIGGTVPAATREIDATGRLVIPGGIDVHTHLDAVLFRETTADDFYSGTVAAAHGGITSICDYAFQRRGRSLSYALEEWSEKARGKAVIDYGFHPVVNFPEPDVIAEIPEIVREGQTSFKIFMIGRFDQRVADYLRVLDAIRDAGAIANIHAEDGPMIDYLGGRLIQAGKGGPEYFPESRPLISEAAAVTRAVAFAEATGAPVYVVHMSSGSAVDVLRAARARGIRVYGETRPIYLHLTSECYGLPDGQGARYIALPPIRGADQQAALWAALNAGDLQTVATDHVCWTLAHKFDPNRNLLTIPPGMSNLETILPMLYSDGVAKGRISANRWVEVIATNPAKLTGMYPQKGAIQPGSDADLVVFDPAAKKTIRQADLHSRADYDVYEGFEVTGWPAQTISRGEVIVDQGNLLAEPGRGRLIKRRTIEPL